jgi:hypothetical protein
MTRFAVVLALGAVLASSGMSPAQNASPYIGQEGRSIKALSETEVRDLMEGRGMGSGQSGRAQFLSRPAPRARIGKSARSLRCAALGDRSSHGHHAQQGAAAWAQFIEAERTLDQAFAQGRIQSDELSLQVKAIAALQGELRAAHLATHIAQRALLTPAQIATYATLRGYQAAAPSSGHRMHDH